MQLISVVEDRLVAGRLDVDAAPLAVELHDAFDQCEQRVVVALADAASGVKLVAHLTDEDVARLDRFATELLDATALCVGIATVAA